jgi:cysteine-rich repeat protein
VAPSNRAIVSLAPATASEYLRPIAVRAASLLPPAAVLAASVLVALSPLGCGARSELALDDVPGDHAGLADAPDAPAFADAADVVDAPDMAPGECGNGRVESGEDCDLGRGNRNVPAFGLQQGAGAEVAIEPVVRATSAVIFYRYESASAHTGFEEVGLANLFLYVDSSRNDLSLFLLAGKDYTGGPARQPRSTVDATFSSLPAGTRVLVSDDVAELAITGTGRATAHWTFQDNSDGGVLGTLPWDSPWAITVDVNFVAGISGWSYVNSASSRRPLTLGVPVVLSHHVTPSACRLDCHLPRCADGFVDGGERCDDGNTRGGDGCAADCRRFE